MSRENDSGAISHTVTVELPLEAAFARFVDDLGDWWPREYTWSGDVLEEIGIEPRQGGMCFERGPHGFRCDWGRILAFEAPHRLVLSWQIGPRREPVPDPGRASEVEIRFTEGDGRTTHLELRHHAFDRHGEEGAGYSAALGSERGWPYILGRYADARP